MTVYFDKRRKRWTYDFERGGRRYAGYCVDVAGNPVTSRRAAVEAEGVEKRRAEIGPKVARASEITLAQIVADLMPMWEAHSDWTNIRAYVRDILTYFGAERAVATIGEIDVENYITWSKRQPVMVWVGGPKRPKDTPDADAFWRKTERTRSAGTINRHMPVLRAILGRAHKLRDPITGARVLDEMPIVKALAEPKRRARPIPDDVLVRVLETLPQHTREAVITTLLFGFRQGEVFGLEIADVDFAAGGIWLSHDRVKDDEDAFVPGARDAMAFMRTLVDQARSRGLTRLIAWQPRRATPEAQAAEPWRTVKRSKSAWRTAMDEVEAAFGRRWRWHDIRAAYISRVANTVGPLAAQQLARHSSYSTTEAYVLVENEGMLQGADLAAARPALAMIRGGKSQT